VTNVGHTGYLPPVMCDNHDLTVCSCARSNLLPDNDGEADHYLHVDKHAAN